MVTLMSLWLPILLSAVLVFIVSSIIHTVLTYHRSDYKTVPDEAKVMAALRPFNLPPGDYVVPRPASNKEMQTPEFQEKLKQGPVLFMTVFPSGPMAMGPQLVQWFLYCVLISVFAAYLASRTLDPGTAYLQVFRVTGTVAFAGYGLALLQQSIWFKKDWTATLKSLFDALIYAALTAGAFGWRWPA